MADIDGVYGGQGIAGGGNSGTITLDFDCPADLDLPGSSLAQTPATTTPATSRRIVTVAYVRAAISAFGGGGGGTTVEIGPTTPSTAVAGNLWFDTTTNQLKIYTGSVWQVVGGAGIEEAPLTGGPYVRNAGAWAAMYPIDAGTY